MKLCTLSVSAEELTEGGSRRKQREEAAKEAGVRES